MSACLNLGTPCQRVSTWVHHVSVSQPGYTMSACFNLGTPCQRVSTWVHHVSVSQPGYTMSACLNLGTPCQRELGVQDVWFREYGYIVSRVPGDRVHSISLPAILARQRDTTSASTIPCYRDMTCHEKTAFSSKIPHPH